MSITYSQIERKNFFQTFLSCGTRKDSRNFDNIRDTVMNVGSLRHTDGSATVSIGETKVVCGIKAELAKPKAENPTKGFLVVNVEIPPMCSPSSQQGPPSDDAQAASTLLAEIFQQALDLNQLCVAAGKLSWVLYLDIICLNFDGSLLDAAVLAATTALKDTKLPEVSVDPRILVSSEKRTGLNLIFAPFALSFAVFDGAFLQDPTAEEESMAAEVLTIFSSNHSEWTHVYNPGSRPISGVDLATCQASARTRAEKLQKLVKVAQESTQKV